MPLPGSGITSIGCSPLIPPQTVCADRSLNDVDVEMSVLYTQLKPLLGMSARGDMEDEQAAWPKRRTGCRDDCNCLG